MFTADPSTSGPPETAHRSSRFPVGGQPLGRHFSGLDFCYTEINDFRGSHRGGHVFFYGDMYVFVFSYTLPGVLLGVLLRKIQTRQKSVWWKTVKFPENTPIKQL